MFENAYKQFLFPRNEGNKEETLPLEDIKKLISEVAGSSLFRVNILGGNIFQYPKFKELAELLNALSIIKAFYFNYTDLHDQTDIKKLLLSNWKPGHADDDIRWELDVLIFFPIISEKLSDAVSKVNKSGINTKFHFVLQKEEELELAEKVISQFKLSDYTFLPYYNGNNLNFFEDAVFDDRETVLDSRPTQKDIFIRMVINQTTFGKLTVLSNGDIYANVNEPVLGKLGRDSIYDLVYEEVCEGRSWRRRRSDLAPCKECIYQFLCPSTSNYEYALGRNNLCHIL
jgi:pseudo-rSAM protein